MDALILAGRAEVIKEAIEQKWLLVFTYHDKIRIVKPIRYWIAAKTGEHVVIGLEILKDEELVKTFRIREVNDLINTRAVFTMEETI